MKIIIGQKTLPQYVMIFGFILVITFMVAITGIALSRMNDMGEQLEQIVHQHEVGMRLVMQMRNVARERTRILHTMLEMEDPFEIDEAMLTIQQLGEKFLTHRINLVNMKLGQEEADLLAHQRKLAVEGVRHQRLVIKLIQEGEREMAIHELVDKATPVQDRVIAILDQLIELQISKSQDTLNHSIKDLQQSRTYILGIVIVGIALTSLVGFYVVLHIGRAFNSLRSAEQRERAILDNMLEALITINEHGIIESCNPRTEAIFGYRQQELVGNNVSMLMPQPDRDRHDGYIQAYLQSGHAHIIGTGREVVGLRKDGSTVPISLGVTEFIHNGKRVFIGMINDITQRKAAEDALQQTLSELEDRVEERTRDLSQTNRQLEKVIEEKTAAQEQLTYLANYDELTTLPNRTLFFERMSMRITQCKRYECSFALLYLDLDGFKSVNDELGHQTGDELLKQVAMRMRNCLREADDIARIGGDEFTVMINYTAKEKEQVDTVAKKIIEAVSTPYEIDGNTIHIGTSIGISIYPDDTSDRTELLKFADESMYIIKGSGKNNFLYHAERD